VIDLGGGSAEIALGDARSCRLVSSLVSPTGLREGVALREQRRLATERTSNRRSAAALAMTS